ncbi:MAG: aminodeoxychorismate/anthranilate synthase component II [Clostridiaceae bacterium]|nr:aminodeoxychorismate/anthranilate synthase component II [Clostridiaceae bacterium]
MILILDNYDSFTYNLYQYIGTINPGVEVFRNDKITVDKVLSKNPSHIILSPGPGYPKDSGIMLDLIKAAAPRIPLLGVCLGHQGIGEAFGGRVVKAPYLMHGKSDFINIDTRVPIFWGLPEKIEVGRYHSLILEDVGLGEFDIIAKSNDGLIMGIKHKKYDTYGIQFHPESVLTPFGIEIIKNFLSIKGRN